MIKNMTILKLADEETVDAFTQANAIEAFSHYQAKDPSAAQWMTAGFKKLDEFGDQLVFKTTSGFNPVLIFNVEFRERVLPGAVIREEVKKRAEELLKKQDRKLSRRELMQLKDLVVSDLLSKALIRSTSVKVLVIANLIIFDTTSAKKIENICAMMHAAFESLASPMFVKFHLLRGKVVSQLTTSVDLLSTQIFDAGEKMSLDPGGYFSLGSDLLLSGKGSSVRFKDADTACHQVRDFITEGYKVQEARVDWNDRVTFTLNHLYQFKRVRFAEFLMREAASDAGESDTASEAAIAMFESTAIILAGAIKGLLDDMFHFIPVNLESEDEDDAAAESTSEQEKEEDPYGGV